MPSRTKTRSKTRSTSFPIGARSKHTVTPATPADEGFAAARADSADSAMIELREKEFERIAQECLGITLTERGSDSLDFHDVSVATLRTMLEEAYKVGCAAGVAAAWGRK